MGLLINRTGILKHVENTVKKEKAAMTELYRFSSLPCEIKVHLIKALLAPILTYPPIPLITISKTQMKKLQVIQNRGLRFAFSERYPFTRTSKELHEIANLEPINYSLFIRASNIWEKLPNLDNTQYSYLMENYQPDKYHM